MVKIVSTNITSPIGATTEQNYQAYIHDVSALACYGSDKPYVVSLFTDEQREQMAVDGFSSFESLVIRSVQEALSHLNIDITDNRTLFILSTTKANVAELSADGADDRCYSAPGEAAQKIAEHLGFSTIPFVVSNACISGISAQIIAMRMLEAGMYDKVVVCGADIISQFMIAGFQSFMSLSSQPCRPFDLERNGLNLGEAAATVVLVNSSIVADGDDSMRDAWTIVSGAATNDAYHLSAPSPMGDGMQQAIHSAFEGFSADMIATVNAHGTATMFNDQMESKAIELSGLSDVFVSAYKGCFGHTLGAAGLLDTILTIRALEDGIVPPVRGFETKGVSGRISISNKCQPADKRSFLKIISGFGGCNAATLYSKEQSLLQRIPDEVGREHRVPKSTELQVIGEWRAESTFSPVQVYKQSIGDYPKFYKMDRLCQAAFVASELILRDCAEKPTSIILFNRSSSILSDRKHLAALDKFGLSSPSVFLYTLPNIMLGEIAIRHQIHGESSLYILERRDEKLMQQVIDATIMFGESDCILTGWVDCPDEQTIEVELKILKRKRLQ